VQVADFWDPSVAQTYGGIESVAPVPTPTPTIVNDPPSSTVPPPPISTTTTEGSQVPASTVAAPGLDGLGGQNGSGRVREARFKVATVVIIVLAAATIV
jgi:hypothetical protein